MKCELQNEDDENHILINLQDLQLGQLAVITQALRKSFIGGIVYRFDVNMICLLGEEFYWQVNELKNNGSGTDFKIRILNKNEKIVLTND